MNEIFPAKILLFGEYGIIKGSKGLAIPLEAFNGYIDSVGELSKVENKLKLDEFYEYLKGSDLLSKSMDLERFKEDLDKGCFFNSNIPQGYGVGSSGALCAAVYARYAPEFERKRFYNQTELKYLKDIMALMESFYHGSSSGVDCLISLINLPLLIESRSQITLIETPNLSQLGHFYLFDSGHGRKTAAFVHDFLARYNDDLVYKQNIQSFIAATDAAIEASLKSDTDTLEKCFHDISRIQYLHFSPMIPDHLKNIWLKGLETQDYYMKLCGAGGGGYFLIYSKNNKLPEELATHKYLQKISETP